MFYAGQNDEIEVRTQKEWCEYVAHYGEPTPTPTRYGDRFSVGSIEYEDLECLASAVSHGDVWSGEAEGLPEDTVILRRIDNEEDQ